MIGPQPQPQIPRDQSLSIQAQRMAASQAAAREAQATDGRVGTVDRSSGKIVGLPADAFAIGIVE